MKDASRTATLPLLKLMAGLVVAFFGVAFVAAGAPIAITGDELGHRAGFGILGAGVLAVWFGWVTLRNALKQLRASA